MHKDGHGIECRISLISLHAFVLLSLQMARKGIEKGGKGFCFVRVDLDYLFLRNISRSFVNRLKKDTKVFRIDARCDAVS